VFELVELDVVLESETVHVVHNQIESLSLSVQISFVHLDDAWVVQLPQKIQLPQCYLLILLVFGSDNLHSESFPLSRCDTLLREALGTVCLRLTQDVLSSFTKSLWKIKLDLNGRKILNVPVILRLFDLV
jgi:hypothetical protein